MAYTLTNIYVVSCIVDCQRKFGFLAMNGSGRSRGEQQETTWSQLERKVGNNTRYMTSSNRAGVIEWIMQLRNGRLATSIAFQLYLMAHYAQHDLCIAREDFNTINTLVSTWDQAEVC